jgi:hypothetical protein
MVHEPEGADARKEVRFSKEAVSSTFFEAPKKKAKRPNVRLSTAPIEADNDDDAGERAKPTYDDFKREVTDRLDSVRYTETFESQDRDLKGRVATLADHLAKRTRFKKPGMPLEVWVNGNTLPTAGVVDSEEFAELVSVNPNEVFKEVKLRSLMAIALAEQVKELHLAARYLDDNLKATHDWVPALFENPARDEGGAPATDREEELLATVADQSEKIAELKADAVRLNEAIADFVVQSRQNSTAPPGGGSGDDNDRTLRENSVFSQTSVAGGKRSSKARDPPIFHNEKDRDTEDFEQWYRDIENKLTVNADHFDNDRARQAYIESRMGGKAKRELAPYLRDTHPEPIKTSDRLLTHLWDQYYNPLLAQKALDDYDDLKMGPGADYFAFKNDFVRLAGECGKTRAEWKREFNRRLTPNLQRHLAGAFLDPTVDFDQFMRLGLQQAMINKRANEQQKAERAKSGVAGGNRENEQGPPQGKQQRGCSAGCS